MEPQEFNTEVELLNMMAIKKIVDGIHIDRLKIICDAERERRFIVLPEKLPEYAKQTSVEVDCMTDIRKPGGDFVVKPCPFCGSDNIIYWQYRHAAGLRWRIVCLHCLAMIDPGWVQQYGYLADMWNARADATLKGAEQ